MKIYDISQELFSCRVYPGDPAPEKRLLRSMEAGESYNLTAFGMCAHNGTHIDAPFHFIRDGQTVDHMGLAPFVGQAYVAEHRGVVTAADATAILEKARREGKNAAERILIKGEAEVSCEAAQVFAEAGLRLLGNESQTVGPADAPMAVHLTLLGADVLLPGVIKFFSSDEWRAEFEEWKKERNPILKNMPHNENNPQK